MLKPRSFRKINAVRLSVYYLVAWLQFTCSILVIWQGIFVILQLKSGKERFPPTNLALLRPLFCYGCCFSRINLSLRLVGEIYMFIHLSMNEWVMRSIVRIPSYAIWMTNPILPFFLLANRKSCSKAILCKLVTAGRFICKLLFFKDKAWTWKSFISSERQEWRGKTLYSKISIFLHHSVLALFSA